jgi:hypothetical protein
MTDTMLHAQGAGSFESRTDAASSDLYFHYYSLIQHQCAHHFVLLQRHAGMSRVSARETEGRH